MSLWLSRACQMYVICTLQAAVDFEVIYFFKPKSTAVQCINLRLSSVVQMLLWQTNRGALLAGLCSSYIPLPRFWAGLGGRMVH